MKTRTLLLRPDFLLFTLCLAIYLLTMGGHLYSADNEIKGMIAEGIVERHSISLPESNMMYMSPGRDRLSYSYFALGSSLTMIPFYLLGDAISVWLPATPRDIVLEFCYGTINSIAAAISCTALFLVCCRLGYSVRTGIATALIFGFSTIVWPYAKTAWSEPQALCCVLLSFLCLIIYRDRTNPGWLVLSGALMGYGITTRSEVGLLLLVFSGYIVLSLWHESDRLKRITLAGLTYGAPLVVFCFINLYYNYLRYEDWLNFGQLRSVEQHIEQVSPFWDSVEGLLVGTYQHLFSTGKGLLVFSPPLLMFYWASKRFYRRNPLECAVCIAVPVVFFVSAGTSWQMAFMAWGERYFVTLTPFLVLPIASILEEILVDGGTYMKRSLAFLVAVGIAVQLTGVSINFQATSDRLLEAGDRFDIQQLSYDPEYSPILLNFKEAAARITGSDAQRNRAGEQQSQENPSGKSSPDLSDKSQRQQIRFNSFDFWFSYMHASGFPLVLIVLPIVILAGLIVLSSRQLYQISRAPY